MITYELFTRLYEEALESASLEYYIAERGWQKWMDNFSEKQIVKILKTIYGYANKNLKEIREKYYPRAEFCRKYRIPIRTVENWDAKKNYPEYIKVFILYTFFIKEFLNEHKNKD